MLDWKVQRVRGIDILLQKVNDSILNVWSIGNTIQLFVSMLSSKKPNNLSYSMESILVLIRSVAQLVEHRSPKPGVAGSIPATPANFAFYAMDYRVTVIGNINND